MAAVKILVVEDELLVSRDIEGMLKNLGFEVVSSVPSGEQAIYKAKEKSPDLILMDIVLKGELDGIAAAQKIKENFGIPIIYLTAHADETTLSRAKSTNPLGYLLKPFEQRELQTTIEIALDRHIKEKKVQERENWFESLLKIMKEAVVFTDKNGVVTFMNRPAEELTGWIPSETCGKPLSTIFKIMNRTTGEKTVFPFREKSRKNLWHSTAPSLLTAKNGREIPVDVTAALIKDKKGKLLDTVFVFQDAGEKWRKDEDLARWLTHDRLTGLPNRLLFCERLSLGMALAQRHHQKVAIMMLELNRRTKSGSSASPDDARMGVPQSVAVRLTEILRKSDTIARLESGEFILLLLEISRVEDVASTAQRILQVFQRPFSSGGRKIHLNVRMGASIFPDDGDDFHALFQRAHSAMFAAQEKGGPLCFFSANDPDCRQKNS
ncbi:MAG: diguanylate cyclase [Candidatus Aminicenantales bacterium]